MNAPKLTREQLIALLDDAIGHMHDFGAQLDSIDAMMEPGVRQAA